MPECSGVSAIELVFLSIAQGLQRRVPTCPYQWAVRTAEGAAHDLCTHSLVAVGAAVVRPVPLLAGGQPR
jgi:hypothetical protein